MNESENILWQKNDGRRFLERVGVCEGKTVLDFGCREGIYARMAARIAGPGGKVFALDKDRHSLDELNRLAENEHLNNLIPVLTSGNIPIPLRDASVDIVLLYDVLHLIGWMEGETGETIRRSTSSERRAMLGEVFRVSRPSAIVSVFCPHLETHTDVESEQEIVKELLDEGFEPRGNFHASLIHDGSLEEAHIINFTKPSKTNHTL